MYLFCFTHTEYEVEHIVDERKTNMGTEYHVKWIGYAELTWEPEVNRQNESYTLFQRNCCLKVRCKSKVRILSVHYPYYSDLVVLQFLVVFILV